MNYTILEAVLEALHKTEAAMNKADINEACCESEAYETEAWVMEAEAIWEVNNTEEARVNLERAYEAHDKACREHYSAVETRKELHKLYELLDQATWYAEDK